MSDASATGVLVVKLGGTTIAEEHAVLAEIAALAADRPIVVVHGGGKRLTDWLARLGVESRFEAGLRVTDDAALEVALAVLGGVINGELVAALRTLGADAVGLRGLDGGTIRGERATRLGADAVGLRGLDGGTIRGVRATRLGRVIDQPVADAGLIGALLDVGRLPVVAPLGLDQDGTICNVNADDAAAALSAALGGELLLLTDTDGVRGADGERIPALDASEVEHLIESGVIAGGMVPKVRAALRALQPGSAVRQVVIADGRASVALGRALGGGAGTHVIPTRMA